MVLCLKTEMQRHQHWFTRKSVYLFVLSIVLALSIFTFLFPARNIGDLVSIGTSFNLAGRCVECFSGPVYLSSWGRPYLPAYFQPEILGSLSLQTPCQSMIADVLYLYLGVVHFIAAICSFFLLLRGRSW